VLSDGVARDVFISSFDRRIDHPNYRSGVRLLGRGRNSSHDSNEDCRRNRVYSAQMSASHSAQAPRIAP